MKAPIWALIVAGILLVDAVLVALEGGWRESVRTILLVALFILLFRRPAAGS